MSTLPKTAADVYAWESLVEILSKKGYMARFYKLPRFELKAVAKLWGDRSHRDLNLLFAYFHQGRITERNQYIETLSEGQIFAILILLGRCMKCWIETDLPAESRAKLLRGKWTIARA